MAAMQLAEWREWWTNSGARQLRHLLRKHWDVARDEPTIATDEFLLAVAHRLREGATAVDVRLMLGDLRREVQGERFGRKWATRDGRVAEKIVVWYVEAMN
jgi:hypothetical protein